jgi:mono/diheme cytochrome c family protein
MLVGAVAVAALATAADARQQTAPAAKGNAEAAALKNPVPATPESIAAGRKTYQEFGCATCHGADAEGGMSPSITEDRGLPPPPELNDDKWTHGGTDGEIFMTIKNGVPPDYIMGPYDGRIPDPGIWNVVNFLRSVAQKK